MTERYHLSLRTLLLKSIILSKLTEQQAFSLILSIISSLMIVLANILLDLVSYLILYMICLILIYKQYKIYCDAYNILKLDKRFVFLILLQPKYYYTFKLYHYFHNEPLYEQNVPPHIKMNPLHECSSSSQYLLEQSNYTTIQAKYTITT